MKTNVNTSIEGRVIEKARENRLNVSQVLEDALIDKINEKRATKEIPEDKFTEEEYELIRGGFQQEPKDNLTWFYCINQMSGKLERRGEPLFFINLHGRVREVDFKTWKMAKFILGSGKEEKQKEKKLGDINLES